MPKLMPLLNPVAGLAGAILYVAFALAAYTHVPGPFTPIANWLSDLGNRDLNLLGAAWYRLAAIVPGAALLAFFATLGEWGGEGKPAARILVRLVQAVGAAASLCFVLTGVYPEDMMPMHSWFSIGNFVAFGTAIALTGRLAFYDVGLPRWFAVFCFTAAAVDILSGVLGQTRILEWVVVGFLLAYIASLSVLALAHRWSAAGRWAEQLSEVAETYS